MREIKFRVWDRYNHVMETSPRFLVDISDGQLWENTGTGCGDRLESTNTRFILMQFTGLQDSQGAEIWEGDVVVVPGQYIWFDDDRPNYVGVVEWVFSQWQVIAYCVNPDKRGISHGANYGLNDSGYEDAEKSEWLVIGNIYQNPKLIEE